MATELNASIGPWSAFLGAAGGNVPLPILKSARRRSRAYIRRVSSGPDADDMSAEVIARLWLMREAWGDDHTVHAVFEADVISLTREVSREYVAATRRLVQTTDGELKIASSLEPAESISVDEAARRREWLKDTLATLPRDQRCAVELRVIWSLNYSIVADALGISEGAARVRVSRGLRTLRTALGNQSVPTLVVEP